MQSLLGIQWLMKLPNDSYKDRAFGGQLICRKYGGDALELNIADEARWDANILDLPWKARKQASEAPAGPAPEMRTSTSITGKPVLASISGIVIIRIVFAACTCFVYTPLFRVPGFRLRQGYCLHEELVSIMDVKV